MLSADRWTEVTRSRYPHEIAALQLIRAALPDAAPIRAWSNFEFIADNGALYEVDLLVVTRAGFFLVELKHWGGTIAGTGAVWDRTTESGAKHSVDSPYFLANRKAKALSSLLKLPAPHRLPFLETLVFLTNPELKLELEPRDRSHVVTPEGFAKALLLGEFPGAVRGRQPQPVDEPMSQAIAQVMKSRVRKSASDRRVGEFDLGDLLFLGPGFQDFVATHRTLDGFVRRIRRYNTTLAPTPSERERTRRSALREYRLLASMSHPNVVAFHDYVEHELGPCLLFEHRPDAVRLDHFVRQKGARLSHDERLDLLRQLADAVRYMHGRGVFHRALSPDAVLVTSPRTRTPVAQVFCWQTGADTEDSSGTSHLDRLVMSTAHAFLAPEALTAPDDARELADVFSLGALAWFLFTGTPPAPDLATLRERLRRDGGLMLAAARDGIPAPVHDLVYAATRANPAERLASADDFLASVEACRRALLEPPPQPDPDPLQAEPGQRLPGGFVLERRLGSGSTAVALLVKRNDRPYVLKVARSADDNDRLRREGEVLERLKHPQIAAWHETLTLGGRVALLLDFAGEPLRNRLRADGPMQPELLQTLGRDLADLLVYLENMQMPHRDLKPENIALRKSGRPERLRAVLFDFSLAQAPVEQARLGTAAYRDPFLDTPARRAWDLFADRYSLALVLYEMATGTLPVWGDGRVDPHLIDAPLPQMPPELLPAEHRAGLLAFFARALARDTADRFESAEALRDGWTALFAEAERAGEAAGEPEEPSSLAGVGPDTPVALLPDTWAPGRVRTALDRADIGTVRDLLTAPAQRFRFMRGVGARTRADLARLLLRLREQFPGIEAAPEPPSAAGTRSLEALLERASARGHGAADAVRRLWLGLDGPAGDWPSVADVAERLGRPRAAVARHLHEDDGLWRADPELRAVAEHFEAALDELGGVATPALLADALLARGFETAAEPEQARRLAGALARVAFTVARGGEEAADARVLYRRTDRVVLVARSEGLLEWAFALGRAADALVADGVAAPARAWAVLGAVEPPAGTAEAAAFDRGRVLQLAALTASQARLSARQELYPRGLSAAVALRLTLGALLSVGEALTPDDVRTRVSARYPEADALPDRPALDALLRGENVPLVYDEAAGCYRTREVAASSIIATSQTTYRTRLSTTVPPGPAPAERSPESIERRAFDDRLQQASAPGSFLVLSVAPKLLADATAQLGERAQVVSLEAVLLDALRAEAKALGAAWPVVIAADAAPAGSRDARNLRLLLDRAMPRVDRAVLEAAPGGHLLLVEAGLLVHFDRTDLFDRLREALREGRAAAKSAWVLIPQDEQQTWPVLDGKPIPVLTPAQAARVPEAWLGKVLVEKGAA